MSASIRSSLMGEFVIPNVLFFIDITNKYAFLYSLLMGVCSEKCAAR